MNMIKKSLFALIFLFAISPSTVFARRKKKSQNMEIFNVTELVGFTKVREESSKSVNGDIITEKWEKIIFSFPWIGPLIKHTKTTVTIPILSPGTGETTPLRRRTNENPYELCKKTKAFLGTVFLSSVVGAGYYFDWFRKK